MQQTNVSRVVQGGEAKDVLDSIRQIIRSLRVASRAAEKELGLSSAQLLVLQRLARGKPLSLNELAEHTQTHQSSTSVVVSKLVSRGLLVRSRAKGDGRRLELSITRRAKLLVRKTPRASHDRLRVALDTLSKPELKQLSGLLRKIAPAQSKER